MCVTKSLLRVIALLIVAALLIHLLWFPLVTVGFGDDGSLNFSIRPGLRRIRPHLRDFTNRRNLRARGAGGE